MEFRQLYAFYEVVNTGSFTRAGESLGYAQSSITTQIQLLEQELGTPLFERFGKRIILTENGRCFLTYTKQILNLSKEAKEVVSDSITPRGSITIGAPESLCSTRLPIILQEFRKRYPHVKILLKTGACNDFHHWLNNNLIDIAFFFQQKIIHPELIATPLLVEPMVVVAGAGHHLIPKGIIKPADLHGETLILAESDCTYRITMESILRSSSIYPESILEFSSVAAMKLCAINGLGITLLPRIVVNSELENGQLVDLHWAGDDFNIVTQIVYHKDKWLSPALTSFISVTKEILQEASIC